MEDQIRAACPKRMFSACIVAVWLSLMATGVWANVLNVSATPPPNENAWATPVDKAINLYQMTASLYRSALPDKDSVPLLQRLKVQTVVSFIKEDDSVWLGHTPMFLVSIPLHADRVDDADVLRVLRILQTTQLKGPVLMHCKHGRNRTGLMAAMYRTVLQGWSKEEALKEMLEGGYGDPQHVVEATRYVERADITQLRQAFASGDCSTSRFAMCRVRNWLTGW